VKHYGLVTSLDGLTVKVPRGIVGLLGPNGAGKSTLLKVLLGLTAQSSGKCNILGHDLEHEGPNARKLVGFMPEFECLPKGETGVNFVMKMGRLSGLHKSVANQRAHEVLNFLRMGDERYRKISQYSGGMKQKIKLAQALVHDPKVLFLDEPTSGLDPYARTEMLRTIQEISTATGNDIVLSTHIMSDVEGICKHVMMIDKGKLVLNGPISDLMEQSGLIIDVRITEEPQPFIDVLKGKGLEVSPGEEKLQVKMESPETVDTIIAAAAESEVSLRQLYTHKASLDEIYISQIKAHQTNESRKKIPRFSKVKKRKGPIRVKSNKKGMGGDS